MSNHPNLLFVFGDQWRAQAFGYAGNRDVRTPQIDSFAADSLSLVNAVSSCPVCCPWRATLMTGQSPLNHGVFINDAPITSDAKCLGECFRDAGYDTGYIGKWHIDGHGRGSDIPPERRKGFDYWKGRECTHDYNRSFYYGDGPEKRWWDGYDAIAQTRDAESFIRAHADGNPFMLIVSWGPPHAPYDTAPETFRRLYRPEAVTLRPNVPAAMADQAREWIAGYYAHCTALDTCFGELLRTVEQAGLTENTIVVFTADHGDMLGSHGHTKKQRPWAESVGVPMLIRWPDGLGREGRLLDGPFGATDIMPTLLGMCGLDIPDTVEGHDFTQYLRGNTDAPDSAALIELPACFHQFAYHNGGKDWRGLRTTRYTYAITHDGPWLLYDNESDPYQLHNLAGAAQYADLQAALDADLRRRLGARGDRFPHGANLIAEAGFTVNERGDPVYQG